MIRPVSVWEDRSVPAAKSRRAVDESVHMKSVTTEQVKVGPVGAAVGLYWKGLSGEASEGGAR